MSRLLALLVGATDRTYRVLSKLSQGINAVGTLIVLGLVAIVNYEVVARGAFNAPFRGSVELVQFSLVLIVFLQLPDVVRSGRLTRSDGLVNVLGKSRPRVTGIIRRAINLISAVLMLLVAITMWPDFVEAWETNDFFGTPGIFTAPWWPIKLAIFLSAVLCFLLWMAKACGSHPEGSAEDQGPSAEEDAADMQDR